MEQHILDTYARKPLSYAATAATGFKPLNLELIFECPTNFATALTDKSGTYGSNLVD
jgi:hypothetical protein